MNVAFVLMPFHSVHRPSYALSILKEQVIKSNHNCDVLYLNILYSKMLKDYFESLEYYTFISEINTEEMLGEVIFSNFVEHKLTEEDYVEYFSMIKDYKSIFDFHNIKLNKDNGPSIVQKYVKVADLFLKKCMEIDWRQFDVIGFSVTFQQLMASLALAKMIKEKYPNIKIAFGGNTVHNEMGLAAIRRYNDIIDVVFLGEGEEAWPYYLNNINKYDNLPPEKRAIDLKNKYDLNKISIPNYDDYFCQFINELGEDDLEKVIIMYEFSRGCWWAKKKKCLFCGLNCKDNDYRIKNFEKTKKESKELFDRYGKYTGRRLALVDNIIPIDFIKNIINFKSCDGHFFFETKSNFISDSYFIDMKESGFIHSQPGIESLHDETLKFMNKGVDAITNIAYIKQCIRYGIKVTWNILINFCNENDKIIDEQIELIRELYHLPPPTSVVDVRLDRYSDYFEHYRDKLGTITPKKTYKFVFNDLNDWDLFYYFDYSKRFISPSKRAEIMNVCEEWKKHHSQYKKIILNYKGKDYVYIKELANEELLDINEVENDILLLTKLPINFKEVNQKLSSVYENELVEKAMAKLIHKKVLLRINDKLLSLAIDMRG